MRLVADENMPAAMVAILREAGHDVVFITEDTTGKADADIMAQAVTDRPGSGYPGQGFWFPDPSRAAPFSGRRCIFPTVPRYAVPCPSPVRRPQPDGSRRLERLVLDHHNTQKAVPGIIAFPVVGAVIPISAKRIPGLTPALSGRRGPLGAAPRRGSPVPAGQRCRLRSGPAPPSPAQLCNRRLRRR